MAGFEKGETFVLDEKPFDGELLNMSKLLDVFPELLAAIGEGPITSGEISSRRINSVNAGFNRDSVPFMAT